MYIKQGKLEWKDKLKPIRNELKQQFGELCEQQKTTVCPAGDPPRDNPDKGVNREETAPM